MRENVDEALVERIQRSVAHELRRGRRRESTSGNPLHAAAQADVVGIAAGTQRDGMAMSDVVNFGLPAGYRVVSTEAATAVEGERGCGWRLRVVTLSGLPADARDQLFRYHETWHAKQH
jgi:hypothetical protein